MPEAQSSEILTIPVFPLPNVVLFPGMLLRLNIFEPRYREMVKTTLDSGGTFGIQLCKHYNPITLQGEPYDVGTTVEFLEVEPLSDGRYHLLVRGDRRYQVSHYDDRLNYLRGTVFYLNEDDKRKVSLKSDLMKETQAHFLLALRLAMGLLKEDYKVPELPQDPEALSYLIAENLRGSLPLKQSLLEMTSTRGRLKREREILENLLKTLSVQSQIEAVFRESGHSSDCE